MRYRLIAAVAASLAIASPAAAVVRYDFLAPTNGLSFSLTRADFITGPLAVDAAELDSCLVRTPGAPIPCLGADFDFGFPTGEDRIGVRYLPITGAAESFFYFPAGAFARAGVHRGMGFFEAELRVTDFKGGAAPEPAAWALMIAGFGLTGGALRRRRLVAAVAG